MVVIVITVVLITVRIKLISIMIMGKIMSIIKVKANMIAPSTTFFS